MKISALIFCAFFLTSTLFSQEETVKEIRKIYIDYNKKIEDAKNEGVNYLPTKIEVSTIQNRPALGPVSFNITYFYDEHTNIDENYDVMKNWAIIRKVIYKEGMPSYTDYKEILFDENGNLIFFYSKLSGYTCGEKRFYFDKNKLVKVKFNPFENEDYMGENDFPSFTRYGNNLNKDDLDWQKAILEEAAHHKKAFEHLYESTQ